MSSEGDKIVKGLQIWTPEASFKNPENVHVFESILPSLAAVDVKYNPTNRDLYCTGYSASSRVAYHIVTQERITEQQRQMRRLGTETLSCLMPDLRLSKSDLREEALVQNLHLGLGRTCLFLAAEAENSADYRNAMADLTKIFKMLKLPIHDVKAIKHPAPHKDGLIHMAVKTGRRYRVLRQNEASELADALTAGMVPGDKTRWSPVSATNFQSAIMGRHYKPRHTPAKTRPRPKRPTPDTPGKRHAVIVRSTAEEAPPPPPISPQKRFLLDIDDSRQRDDVDSKINRLHTRYCSENAEVFTIPPGQEAINIAYKGVAAYVEMRSRNRSDLSAILTEYLTPPKNIIRRDMKMVLAAANLLTAKMNVGGAFNPPKKLPGMLPEAVPYAFKLLRQIISTHETGRPEKPQEAKFGDIVEAYLQEVYPRQKVQTKGPAP